jgi:fused signal recognition particle receptor
VGLFGTIAKGLAKTRDAIAGGFKGLFFGRTLDESLLHDVETALLRADVGPSTTKALLDEVRAAWKEKRLETAEQLQPFLQSRIAERLRFGGTDIAKAASPPTVVLVCGVNGSGKTTSIGKLTKHLKDAGNRVVLAAADTFRAAAADQLATWAGRVGAEVVRGLEGADPASVAFDAVKRGVDAGVDTVLVDTAGRLQNKVGLMDELGKVKRVVEKHGPVDETLLVLDATTGQNGLVQARVFGDVVDVSGIVLTKLDGTAKGGIVFRVQRELGVPVKLVGLGEGADDLAPFEPAAFVDALLT